MANGREDFVFAAELAEQAERYDEMVQAVKEFVKAAGGAELTTQERNFLSVAFKNITGSRRGAWRILSNIESKEEMKINNGSGNELSPKKLQQAQLVSNKLISEQRINHLIHVLSTRRNG